MEGDNIMSEYSILKDGSLSVEGARILWTNFAGRPTKYNAAGGKRTFNLVLDQETADELTRDGWNVRTIEPKEEGDEPLYVTEVEVKFGNFPPKVFLVEGGDSKRMHKLDDESVSSLDTTEIANVDVLVRPYNHGVANSRGTTIKGYVKSMYVTQDNSDFNGKYSGYAVDADDRYDDEEELPFH